MAKLTGRLRAADINSMPAGLHGDGDNLYLHVKPGKDGEAGTRSWLFIYRFAGRQRYAGVGKATEVKGKGVTLAEARKKAAEGRGYLRERPKRDPLSVWKAPAAKTFGDAAEEYLADNASKWSNKKHAAHWRMALMVYAKPLHKKHPGDITKSDVLDVLRPLWARIPESADRVRSRIAAVIEAARDDEDGRPNPASWSRLKSILPPPTMKAKPGASRATIDRGGHAAMPYADVPAFLARLREGPYTPAAAALEYTVLTACRTKEVRLAEWSEVDFQSRVWTVPAEQIDAAQERGFVHVVPLSDGMLRVLVAMREASQSKYIFPGRLAGRAIGAVAMIETLRRFDRVATVHGTARASFGTWAMEETSFPHEVCEHALAHLVGDKFGAGLCTQRHARAPARAYAGVESVLLAASPRCEHCANWQNSCKRTVEHALFLRPAKICSCASSPAMLSMALYLPGAT